MTARRIGLLATALLPIAIGAPATSQVAPVDDEPYPCHYYCLKPWAVCDRWDDANGNGRYDAGEYYDPIRTGYLTPGDVGAPIVLKRGGPTTASVPGLAVVFPPLGRADRPLVGGSWYRKWITGCAAFFVMPGDSLLLEPGNMAGSTVSAVNTFLARDPEAFWDPVTRTVHSPYSISPRLVAVPFFDPRFPPASGRSHVHVSKLAVVFVESVGPGGQVNGRFIKLTAPGVPCAQDADEDLALEGSAAPAASDEPGPVNPYSLHPASPNPFRSATRIRYTLGAPAPVRIRVFDAAGRLVRTLVDLPEQPAGDHRVTWDGHGQDGLPAARGVYLYRLQAGSFTEARRVILIR